MENINTFLFYIISICLLCSSILSIVSFRIIYSVLFAVLVFISTGCLYFLLNAQFNGVAQLIIYGTGVAILLVFAIMFTSYKKEKEVFLNVKPRVLIALLGIGLIIISSIFLFIEELKKSQFSLFIKHPETSKTIYFNNTIQQISEEIFTNYIFAFELLGVFFLLAIIGIGIICINKKKDCDKND